MSGCKFIEELSDFELLINQEGNIVRSRSEPGFEWLFRTAKANIGIKSGKFMYEIRILEFINNQEYQGPDSGNKNAFTQNTLNDNLQKHAVRVGWSTIQSIGILGSDLESCGYENNGNKIYGAYKRSYGDLYGVGDVIRCCIELGQESLMSFYKNGVYQGIAYKLSPKLNNKSYHPTISIRNVAVEINFGNQQIEFFPLPNAAKQAGYLQANQQDNYMLYNVQTQPNNSNAGIQPQQQQSQTNILQFNTDKIDQSNLQKDQLQNTSQDLDTLSQQQLSKSESQILPQLTDQSSQNEQNKMLISNQYQQQQNQNLLNINEKINPQMNIDQNINPQGKKIIQINEYNFVNQSNAESSEIFSTQKNSDQMQKPILIMMIGIPCSGKTTFVKQYTTKNPDYLHLGTYENYDHIVNNLRIRNLKWNVVILMEICNDIFYQQLKVAAQGTKNVIIDQCNLLLKPRMEKLNMFPSFQKQAIAIVLTETEWKKRQTKKERTTGMLKYPAPKVGLETYRNLLENFAMPTEQEGFTYIQYLEQDEEKSKKIVLLNNEQSFLRTHPLLRKKQFSVIDEMQHNQYQIQQEVKQQDLQHLAQLQNKFHSLQQNQQQLSQIQQVGTPSHSNNTIHQQQKVQPYLYQSPQHYQQQIHSSGGVKNQNYQQYQQQQNQGQHQMHYTNKQQNQQQMGNNSNKNMQQAQMQQNQYYQNMQQSQQIQSNQFNKNQGVGGGNGGSQNKRNQRQQKIQQKNSQQQNRIQQRTQEYMMYQQPNQPNTLQMQPAGVNQTYYQPQQAAQIYQQAQQPVNQSTQQAAMRPVYNQQVQPTYPYQQTYIQQQQQAQLVVQQQPYYQQYYQQQQQPIYQQHYLQQARLQMYQQQQLQQQQQIQIPMQAHYAYQQPSAANYYIQPQQQQSQQQVQAIYNPSAQQQTYGQQQ